MVTISLKINPICYNLTYHFRMNNYLILVLFYKYSDFLHIFNCQMNPIWLFNSLIRYIINFYFLQRTLLNFSRANKYNKCHKSVSAVIEIVLKHIFLEIGINVPNIFVKLSVSLHVSALYLLVRKIMKLIKYIWVAESWQIFLNLNYA